jgi:hypothetical protein
VYEAGHPPELRMSGTVPPLPHKPSFDTQGLVYLLYFMLFCISLIFLYEALNNFLSWFHLSVMHICWINTVQNLCTLFK